MRLKIILFITLGLLTSCSVTRDVTKYHYDIGSIKTFDTDLQIVDLNASGRRKKSNFILFRYESIKNVNNITFSIQADNGPISRDRSFTISKVEIEGRRKRLFAKEPLYREFSSYWSIDYTDDILPDYVEEGSRVSGWSEDSYDKIKIGNIDAKYDNYGSFYYNFYFEKILKRPKKFKILIYYTIGENSEEKVLEVNVTKKGVSRRVTSYFHEYVNMR